MFLYTLWYLFVLPLHREDLSLFSSALLLLFQNVRIPWPPFRLLPYFSLSNIIQSYLCMSSLFWCRIKKRLSWIFIAPTSFLFSMLHKYLRSVCRRDDVHANHCCIKWLATPPTKSKVVSNSYSLQNILICLNSGRWKKGKLRKTVGGTKSGTEVTNEVVQWSKFIPTILLTSIHYFLGFL